MYEPREEELCTVDGVYGRLGRECLFAIEEYCIGYNVVSDVYSSISSSYRPNSACSTHLAWASSKGSSVSAISLSMNRMMATCAADRLLRQTTTRRLQSGGKRKVGVTRERWEVDGHAWFSGQEGKNLLSKCAARTTRLGALRRDHVGEDFHESALF
jgi:hypothetical protein